MRRGFRNTYLNHSASGPQFQKPIVEGAMAIPNIGDAFSPFAGKAFKGSI